MAAIPRRSNRNGRTRVLMNNHDCRRLPLSNHSGKQANGQPIRLLQRPQCFQQVGNFIMGDGVGGDYQNAKRTVKVNMSVAAVDIPMI